MHLELLRFGNRGANFARHQRHDSCGAVLHTHHSCATFTRSSSSCIDDFVAGLRGEMSSPAQTRASQHNKNVRTYKQRAYVRARSVGAPNPPKGLTIAPPGVPTGDTVTMVPRNARNPTRVGGRFASASRAATNRTAGAETGNTLLQPSTERQAAADAESPGALAFFMFSDESAAFKLDVQGVVDVDERKPRRGLTVLYQRMRQAVTAHYGRVRRLFL
jgi:hypothetical protein